MTLDYAVAQRRLQQQQQRQHTPQVCQFAMTDLDEDEHQMLVQGINMIDSSTSLASLASRHRFRDTSEESEAARSCQERPTSLAISNDLRPPAPSDLCPQDFSTGSLPTSSILPRKCQSQSQKCGSNHAVIPRIKYSSYVVASAPSTPLAGAGGDPSGWQQQQQHDVDEVGSISSVDEAVEATNAGLQQLMLSPDAAGQKKKSKSRLSLNLIRSEDCRASSPSPTPRSPSLIPRFLRNSFSKLMNRESKKSDKDLDDDLVITPTTSSSGFKKCPTVQDLQHSQVISAPSSYQLDPSNVSGSLTIPIMASSPSGSEFGGPVISEGSNVPLSPDTLHFLEETKLNSLPVIPFTFPTAVIAEKLKNKSRQKQQQQQQQQQNEGSASGTQSTTPANSSPRSLQRCSCAPAGPCRGSAGPAGPVGGSGELYKSEFGPSSLKEIVSDAERELLFEAQFGNSQISHPWRLPNPPSEVAAPPLAPSASGILVDFDDPEEPLSVYSLALDDFEDDDADDADDGYETSAGLAHNRAVAAGQAGQRLTDDGYFDMMSNSSAASRRVSQPATACSSSSPANSLQS